VVSSVEITAATGNKTFTEPFEGDAVLHITVRRQVGRLRRLRDSPDMVVYPL
jgi:hypothetical protein